MLMTVIIDKLARLTVILDSRIGRRQCCLSDYDDFDSDDDDVDRDDDNDADADEGIEINYQNWQIGVNLDGYIA